MKKTLFFSFVVAAIFSCTKSSDDKPLDTNSILGTWQLVEVSSALGNNPVGDGYTYTFNEDSTFVSNKFIACSLGSYFIDDTQLTIIYDCDLINSGNPPGTLVENYSFTNNRLHLIPTYLDCVEGCTYKFKKIDEPENL